MPEPVTTKDQLIQNIKDGKPVIANVIFSQPFVFDPKDNKDIMIANCRGVSTEPNNLEWLDDVLDMEMEHLKDDDGNDLYLKEDALILRDKQKLAITAKINEIEKEAQLNISKQDKFLMEDALAMHKTPTRVIARLGSAIELVEKRIAELRKRKDEVLGLTSKEQL